MTTPSVPPVSNKSKPGWLLVVDDDEPIRAMVTEFLADSGLEIVCAPNGAEAMAELATRPTEPVLALVDVLMPGIDGLTLAKKMQARFKRTTIVIMSGHMSNLSWWPMELRDIPFLAKPFRLAELNELLAGARENYDLEN
jgi:two-component system cell cycle sensor histidine kinase/response regulator CckA